MCSRITTLPTKKDTHNKQKQNIMKKTFICTVCGYMYEGTEAPAECPICHSKTEKFKAFDANAIKGTKPKKTLKLHLQERAKHV